MNRLAASLLAPAIALALSAGLYAQMGLAGAVDSVDTTAFHGAVRAALDQIPYRIGDFDGQDKRPPEAAGKLLRPNGKIFSRVYKNTDNQWVNLILVPCKDARDMSGHYPPNCYRGSGWTQQAPPTEHVFELFDRQVPVAEYKFTRVELGHEVSWIVYDFFVLPTGGFVTDMADVRKASGDYRIRPYGGSQMQIIFDATTEEKDRLSLMQELLVPFGPVIDRLKLKKQGDKT